MVLSTVSSRWGDLPVWDLTDLYSGPKGADLYADLDRLERDITSFASDYRGRLSEIMSSGGLGCAVGRYEALADLLGRVGSYAGLLHMEDLLHEDNRKFYGDMQSRLTHLHTEILFFELELNNLEDSALEAAFSSDSVLSDYRGWVEDLRRERPYQLDEKSERLFHEKYLTGALAWNRLFDETIAGLCFSILGESYSLEGALHLMLSPDSDTRRAAADSLSGVFSQKLSLFSHIMNVLVKDHEISDRWRGFSDVASSRHLSNRVEGEVVDALACAVREFYPRLSHRYYALKAQWMGVDRLPYWDRNAPLFASEEEDILWGDARSLILESYGSFSPRMASIAERFFTDGWIHAPLRDGKSSGAFSHPVVPSAHPYILMNYQGRSRDVMTLAHELGHGVHQVLASDRGALLAPTPLTLAETASVFGEMLTFRRLLRDARSDGDILRCKRLLSGKIEDMLNTVIRQMAFYEFERRIHMSCRSGELSGEEIGKIWLSVQSESLGPAIDLCSGYEVFWCYIGHFIHSPFYVYAYAFGDCLVNALYSVFEGGHEGFAESYLEMLSAGGSKNYRELLLPFGLDPSDSSFWRLGLSMIEGFIDDLESLDGS